MIQDAELLGRFADEGDEFAFNELVTRHLDLVYSTALRQLAGDAHLAQDVTQVVFTDLARKARALRSRTVLAGWLHQAARYAAAKAVRTQRRREAKEQEAMSMQDSTSEAVRDWERLGPELDGAIGRLKPVEREAVLLRFFERKEWRVIGDRLGVSEDAVQKRVTRALERLRIILGRRGITISSVALMAAVSECAAQAAPAGLAGSVAHLSLAGAAVKAGFLARFGQSLFAAKTAWIAGGVVTASLAVFLAVQSLPGQAPAVAPASADNFHTVMLTRFYNRLFASYPTDNSWGMMPRGIVDLGGVPFRMYGKIDLTGLGTVRDGDFQPARVGEIPVDEHAARLHLLHGTRYDAPDGTPLSCLLLHYENGEDRKLVVSYGVHVRNWHVEATERDSSLRDPRSSVVWNGLSTSNLNLNPKPTRLFKTTFDNPLPGGKIRSIEFLSLFGRASSVILALTLETVANQTTLPPVETADFDDAPYRREILIRTADKNNGQPISNAFLSVTVSEQPREFNFGRYRSDAHGQILLDYPPGKFPILNLRLSAPGYVPMSGVHSSDEGIFPSQITVRLLPAPRTNSVVRTNLVEQPKNAPVTKPAP